MKQTFKNMDELKKQLFDAIDTICRDYEEKHEPEFKVGDWAGYKTVDGRIHLFKIDHFENNRVYGQSFEYEDDLYRVTWECCTDGLISVTKEEIEAHLKRICNKRYIGKKARCLIDNEDIKRIECFAEYDYDDDSIVYNDKDSRNMYIYQQGKFAEIIPDKKKRPETRAEFEEFLIAYNNNRLIPFEDLNYYEFLNQYEIE